MKITKFFSSARDMLNSLETLADGEVVQTAGRAMRIEHGTPKLINYSEPTDTRKRPDDGRVIMTAGNGGKAVIQGN